MLGSRGFLQDLGLTEGEQGPSSSNRHRSLTARRTNWHRRKVVLYLRPSGFRAYLEGQGDLVSRLITPITHNTPNDPIVNLLAKSPDPKP